MQPSSVSPAIGIIGGSGLYQMSGVEEVREHQVSTPFGTPSGALREGRLAGQRVVFVPRHGAGHRVDPTHIPYRANIYALKQLGVERVLSVSAVGSMREEIVPGHLVAVDQFIDRTRHREDSFFGDGCVAHIPFAEPVCMDLQRRLVASSRALGHTIHDHGTYLCMEGPAFSTRAESLLYRTWGVDVIGMTNLTEAKLAREAQLCYTTLALSTDYDCWHESHDDVSADAVLETMRKNVAAAQQVLTHVVADLDAAADCSCKRSLTGAVMTSPDRMSPEATARLELLLRR